ncbi:MAG TPA: hypothetical protein VG797_00755 [Phycisphaerales bacterium]|nr:hypothetical protein [Phycisphaerales bacterium]
MSALMCTIAVEPIKLLTEQTGATGAGDAPPHSLLWWFGAWAFTMALLGGMALLGWEWRAWHRAPQELTAFRRLGGRLGLRARERQLVEQLATVAGLPPVALLLSEHAFESALQAMADPAEDGGSRRGIGPRPRGVNLSDVAAVRAKVFGPVAEPGRWNHLVRLARSLTTMKGRLHARPT